MQFITTTSQNTNFMNSKKAKSRKSAINGSRSKAKSGEAEVFVLPPNILQKLGINLENIEATQENSLHLNTTVAENDNLNNLDISNNGELDNFHEHGHIVLEQAVIADSAQQVIDSSEKADENQATSVSETENYIVSKCFNKFHEINFSKDVADNANIFETSTVVTDDRDEAYSSDFSNSNGSIENKNTLTNIPESNSNKLRIFKESENRINIISEEVLDLSQIKQLYKLHTPDFLDLKPVTINTLVSSNFTNNKLFQNVKRTEKSTEIINSDSISTLCKIDSENEYHDKSHSEITDKIDIIQTRNDKTKLTSQLPVCYVLAEDAHVSENNSDIECLTIIDGQDASFSSNSNVPHLDQEIFIDNGDSNICRSDSNFDLCVDFFVTDIDKHSKESEDILEDFVNKITSSDGNEILDEIEKSEKDCVNKSSINGVKLAPIVTGVNMNQFESKFRQVEQLPVKQIKHNSLFSKVCFETVDKPGGSQKSEENTAEPKPLKTYGRSKRSKQHNALTSTTLFESDSKEISTISDDLNEEMNSIDLSNSCKNDAFCLCGDFGRLAYYDSNSWYEHIHFWEHVDIKCDPAIIISLYHEHYNNDFDYENVIDEQQIDNEISKVTGYSICWNNVEEETNIDKFYQDKKFEPCNIVNQATNQCLHKHIDFTKENDTTFTSRDDHDHDTTFEIKNQETLNSEYLIDIGANEIGTVCSGMTITTKINSWKSEGINMNENDTLKNMVLDNEPMFHANCSSLIISDEKTFRNENKESDQEENNEELPAKKENNNESFNMRTLNKNISKELLLDVQSMLDEQTDHVKSKKTGKLDVNEEYNGPKSISCERLDKQFPHKYNDTPQYSGQSPNMSLDKSDLVPIDKTKSSNNKIGKKRKRPIGIQTQWAHSFEPLSKKTLKCGVCEQILAEEEWEDHAAKQHCYIAWKAGETIELENLALLKKLKQHQKDYGKLICTFCGVEIEIVQKFLTHSKLCLKNSPKNPTTTKNEETENEESASLSFKQERLDEKLSICGVCTQSVVNSKWIEHIGQEHNYLAWKDGETLDITNDDAVREHLNTISNNYGGLICSNCGLNRRYVKNYLQHIKSCYGLESSLDDSDPKNVDEVKTENAEQTTSTTVKCGVCYQHMEECNWIYHIAKKHEYLAWKDKEPSVNLDDEAQVAEHLRNMLKQFRELICTKCDNGFKRLKTYLKHIKKCQSREVSTNSSQVNETVDGRFVPEANSTAKTNKLSKRKSGSKRKSDEEESSSQSLAYCDFQVSTNSSHVNETVDGSFVPEANSTAKTNKLSKRKSGSKRKLDEEESSSQTLVKCGVCQKEVENKNWITHIQRAHNYLAMKDGEVLDLNNPENVQDHLYAMSKALGGLTCCKCGIVRKYVKSYLHHVETCTAQQVSYDESRTPSTDQAALVCAVCSQNIDLKDWKIHKMEMHYNLAWIVGEVPVDLKNPYAVERVLKEYREYNHRLVCKICGTSRASLMGFYAHVLTCGKTDEETEPFKNVCEICNKKYLCIYQNQHMTAHREQEYAKERKLKDAEHKQKIKLGLEDETPKGRRRAAEKAMTVIENYTTTPSQYSHNCSTCGFGADSAEELSKHVCSKTQPDSNDSDASVKLECASDDSPDSDVDSDVSGEELSRSSSKKRHKDYIQLSSRVARIPFTPKNPNTYLLESGEEYCKIHFTEKRLFPEWQTCEYEPVPIDKLPLYLPPLAESCKVKFGEDSWTTYTRFEAKKNKGYSIFVGASIQCISWVPSWCVGGDEGYRNYLAVACHRGADSPRYAADQTPRHPGLIQIWDFGGFKVLPKFVLGIAHDYGTVWAMDWCPSGARDLPRPTETNRAPTLGLLAVACSDGFAYVFSVPYPSRNDKLLYKLQPVAELRMTMGCDRKLYQATSLSWSPQKEHSLIVVGYSDGTTAYFDLGSDSPLLKTQENNITVYYPYHDERPHESCVTSVDVYPSVDAVAAAGAVCSATPTGGSMVSRPGVCPARVHSRLTAASALFQPLWPAAMLAGDDAIMNTAGNELEWWGGGRRVGAVRACCRCVLCARVAICSPPLLRVVRMHPAHQELKKQTLGTLQMLPLGRKRKKLADDDLATKVEPISYGDAVKRYGIELKLDKTVSAPHNNKPREQYPDRFPLADVPSMAFCPSFSHHGKLAVATHSGVLFLINV